MPGIFAVTTADQPRNDKLAVALNIVVYSPIAMRMTRTALPIASPGAFILRPVGVDRYFVIGLVVLAHGVVGKLLGPTKWCRLARLAARLDR